MAGEFDFDFKRVGQFVVRAPDGEFVSQHTAIEYAQESAIRHAVANAINGAYTIESPTWRLTTMGFGVTPIPAPDSTPDAFSFTDATNVSPSAVIESNIVTLQGFNLPVNVTIVGGEFSINSGEYSAAPAVVTVGDQLRVRHTASANSGGSVTTTVKVAGVESTFTSTTGEAASFNSYVGVPDPTYTNSALESLGWVPWPYNPYTIFAPANPDNWTSNVENFYYVAPGGTNSGNGYPGNPRGEIPDNPPAGSRVNLDGKLTLPRLNVTWSGTAAEPIFLTGVNDKDTDRIDRTADLISFDGTHTIIDGVTFGNGNSSPSSGVFYFGGSFQCIRNGQIRDDAGFRPSFSALSTPGQDHSAFYRTKIGPCGDFGLGGQGDNDFHGIKVFGTDHLFVECEFDEVQGDGVQVSNEGGGTDPTSAMRIWVAGCIGRRCHQTMLWTKDATDIIFSSNYAEDLFDGNNSASNSAFGGQGDYRNLWIINNHSKLNGEGVKLSGTDTGQSDAYVIGNYIEDQDPQNTPDSGGYNNWAITCRNGGETNVLLNTIRNTLAGIATLGSDNHVYGNYIDLPGTFDHLLTNSEMTNDYNFLRGSSAKLTGTSLGANDIVSDTPGFVDEEGGDLMPAPGSVLIDKVPAAVLDQVFNFFLSRYGMDIREDVLGRARDGESVSIGYLEA